MLRILVGLLALLVAAPVFAAPQVQGNNGDAQISSPAFEVRAYFSASDTTDSEAIAVRGSCSVRATVAGSDVLQIWAVSSPTTAASSGSLLMTISATTPGQMRFETGYYWVKVKSSTATTGGSTLRILCGNTPSPITSLTPSMCETEGIQGIGYNQTTRRWRETCADFNWPGWRDATQATASYKIPCSGDGAPHESCLRNGDTVYKGYWMRLALAAQYTEDGGRVVTSAHAYEMDGAGLLQDGATRAKFPQPFDPEWEARPEFSILGYPTYLMGPQVNRGVVVVGPGIPSLKKFDEGDSSVTYGTPKLVGAFIRDNYGPTSGAGGLASIPNDGPNLNMKSPNQYRVMVGWNKANTYCHTTSNTNAACNREFADANQFKNPGGNEYGYESPILQDFDYATTAKLCLNDSVTGSSPNTGTGLCRGNRMVTCWNAGAASARNLGGCIFDTNGDATYGNTVNGVADLNLGVCESYVDSMQYDRQTLKQDLQIAVSLPNCPDDAASATDCTPTGSAIMGFTSHLFDVSTPIGSWTSPTGQTGAACGAGGAWIDVGYKGGVAGSFSFGAELQKYYFGAGVAMRARTVRRDKIDLNGAGFQKMGFIPSSWYGRDSAGLGDCLSGGTATEQTDDEAACDTETQMGFSGGYGGVVKDSFFARASHMANKSGVVETEAFSNGPNYFENNVVEDALRVNGVADWGDGYIRRNRINGVNVAGAGYPLFTCYSSNCIIEENLIERAKLSYGYGIQFGSTNNFIRRNRYRDVSYSSGQAFYEVKDSLYTVIEDEDLQGLWGNTSPLLRIQPGYFMFHKPSVVFRRNRGFLQIQGQTNVSPAAAIVIQNGAGDSTDRADAFKYIKIYDNDIRGKDGSNPCLVWLETDQAGQPLSQVQEGWGRITVRGNNLDGPGTPDVVCNGTYRTSGVTNDASNDTGPSAQDIWPRILYNVLNGVDALDVPHGWRTVANVPDADTLAEGTKVKVSNGTAGCGHTLGVLTAGAVRISCTAHPNGAGDDATWTAD